MVRASPLGMSKDAAVWASTSAISRETQSLVSAAKANYSEPILERDLGLSLGY